MSDVLKPCPFCGCDRQGWRSVRDGKSLGCAKCGARFIQYHGITAVEDRLADLWNTRTPSLSAALELPEVKALVEAMHTLVGVLEIASVMPDAIHKVYVPRMDAPELVTARAALAAIRKAQEAGE